MLIFGFYDGNQLVNFGQEGERKMFIILFPLSKDEKFSVGCTLDKAEAFDCVNEMPGTRIYEVTTKLDVFVSFDAIIEEFENFLHEFRKKIER